MESSKIPRIIKSKSFDKTKLLVKPDINKIMYTPSNIVEGLLDLLPNELWSNPYVKFLDICCKSGVFLDRIFWRLEEGLRNIIPNFIDRLDHILTKQLYGLAISEELAEISRGVVYGCHRANHPNAFTRQFDNAEGNIKVLETTIGDNYFNYTAVIQDVTGEAIKNVIRRSFGDMKFDVVVGNPPYNKGMDLDFVNMGFELCDKYCVMITPAKWQTAEENQRIASKTINYGQFREKLVPHISKVVFFPDCKDVFDIYQTDGITYYLLDKNNKIDECIVINMSKARGDTYNSTSIRSIKHGESLLNIGHEIILSMEPYKKFRFPVIRGDKRFHVVTNTKVSGYDWYTEHGPRYVLSISRILDVKAGERYDGESKTIFESDSKQECESFVSWLNTRFTRFFLVPNISKLNGILSDHYFRFVPAPPSGKFDHIYTDEELYEAFNLPQKYIDVIEAVVKERK